MNPDSRHEHQPTPLRRAIAPSMMLVILLGLARLPCWHHPTPVHPDEVSFVEGIGFPPHYPVHAPGYPLWVAIGTALATLLPTPYLGYTAASWAASVIGPLMLYLWLRTRFGDELAWMTALAFGVCPLAWFHSVTALTYWTATLFGLAIVIACVRAIEQRSTAALWFAAAALSIGLFLRTDCLIYFGPLFAWGLWRVRNPRGRLAALLPVIAFAGYYLLVRFLYDRAGPNVFADRFNHSREVVLGTSLFGAGLVDGLLRNLVKVGVNLVWDVGPLAIACMGALLIPRGSTGNDSRAGDAPEPAEIDQSLRPVLLLWVGTGLAFPVLFHVVEGYFLWVLPAIYVIATQWLAGRVGRSHAIRVMMVVALLSAAQFLLYPWTSSSTGLKRTFDAKISYLSAQGLSRIDERSRIHHDGDFWHTKAHDREAAETHAD